MAYGSIKADKLVYDNSGSDVDVTVASLTTKASTTGATFTGDVTLNATKELRFADTDSSNYVGFEAPGTVASNKIWVLPAVDGSDGQYLKTDGSGNLGWSSDSAGMPTTGGNFTGDVTFDGGNLDLIFSNNVNPNKIKFKDAGGDDQFQIWGGTAANKNYIKADDGSIEIQTVGGERDITLICNDTEPVIKAESIGGTTRAVLSYDGNTKLQTHTDGIYINGGNILFEGATANDHETTFTVTDPTADRTVTIPDATGTVGLLQSDQAWSGAQRGTVATPATHSSGATYDFDMNAGNNHKLTVGAAVEIGFSNITAGQSGTIEVVNGAFTPTFGSEVHFVGGTVPSLTQSATSYLAYYAPSSSVVFVQSMLNVKQGGT